ncbi:MAG: hypothetical protein K2L12_03965 [Clostridia bacterium]|nr:hypothetical protein [Clostridia bacterium]
MAKNNQSSKKLSAFWIGLIVFLIIATIMAALMGWRTSGFTDWTYGFRSPIASTPDNPNTPDNPDNSGDSSDFGGIMLMSMQIPREMYRSYGIPDEVEEGATEVSAKIDGRYDYLEWSVAWENPDSEWASGRNIDDFLSHGENYRENGSSFWVGNNQGQRIGEPAIITCKLIANGKEYTESCRVEQLRMPKSLWNVDQDYMVGNVTIDSIKGKTLKVDGLSYFDGTLDVDDIVGDFSIVLDSMLLNSLENLGYCFRNSTDQVGGLTQNKGIVTYKNVKPYELGEERTFGFDLSLVLEGEYDETQFWNAFYDTVTSSPSYNDGSQSVLRLYYNANVIYGDSVVLDGFTGEARVYVTSFGDLVQWATGIELSKPIIILM